MTLKIIHKNHYTQKESTNNQSALGDYEIQKLALESVKLATESN